MGNIEIYVRGGTRMSDKKTTPQGAIMDHFNIAEVN
jgi:hypothetical protein